VISICPSTATSWRPKRSLAVGRRIGAGWCVGSAARPIAGGSSRIPGVA